MLSIRRRSLEIRQSTEADRSAIRDVHNQAFGEEKGPVIARLVDDLLDDETAQPILSLVAVENATIVGHILYTKATITQTESSLSARILAPLAILPEAQKNGTGTGLLCEA